MSNFVSRNVLICVVPAVVLLLSVYWFRKKKKIKPGLQSTCNESTLSFNKCNDVSNSRGSLYSSVDCTSDFSNTLSDASSISSPENSGRTQSLSGETSSENATDEDCIEAITVSNHIGKLNYHDASIVEENVMEKQNSQLQSHAKSENVAPVVETQQPIYDNKDPSEDPIANVINMLHRSVNASFNDVLEKCQSVNEISKITNDESSFSSSLLCSNVDIASVESNKSDQKSDLSKISVSGEVTEEPAVAVWQNTLSSELIKQVDHKLIQNSNIAVESDSHSSVLDENSLSSASDESDRQTDFKYKDSPSSVFDGNSISDASDKTDVSNENNAAHLKSDDSNYMNNVDYACDNVNSDFNGELNKNVQYSVKLNKNSLIKTILSTDTAVSEVSSSSFVQNSPSSSQIFSLPTDLKSLPSKLCVSKDLDTIDHRSNQPMQLNKGLDSSEDNKGNSSVVTSSSASETVSLDSENVISSTSSDKSCNQTEEKPQTIDIDGNDATISSSNEIIGKDSVDSLSYIETDTSTETVKYQGQQLELSQNKVSDLDVVDMKSSGAVPGLFVYEFDLPQELCGRLIGKQGKHVKSIKERTNANVFIKRHPYDTNIKTVVVEGSRTSVFEALEIIRRKFPPAQFPTVTLIQTNMITTPTIPESLQLHLPEGASCDVILSSLVSAGHFFLQQPTHPTYPSLGTLDQCMITCYTQVDTPLLPHPVEAGVICAAPVMNGWFRAQIIYVFENRTECEIKFVDYGGFSQVPISSLRQIRSDFMTLPFQASECYLANVRPVDGSTNWSSEATSVFEELAQGQILQALLIEYAEDGIPCVHLYRVQGVSNMFINRELVERGLALWVEGHWDPH